VSELSWWTAPHPDWEPGEDWPEDVPVVRYETRDEVVLIDPFLPTDGGFDPHGKPVQVLLTQGAHYRGTARGRRAVRSVCVGPAERALEEDPEPGDEPMSSRRASRRSSSTASPSRSCS
jgi:hypothetical protein